ncbi:MAG: hypothetical protein ACP5D5_09425 [Acidithiobacillus sp.]|uniref:hypothetical protein n=1 Tax=Acidithiobacillus sp. TaxID=1872118 RepID=UPI003D06DDC0
MSLLDFYRLLAQALSEFARNGYDNQETLNAWLAKLRHAANQALPGPEKVRRDVQARLGQMFKRAISEQRFKRQHPWLTAYTIQRMGPKLAPLLERRILASVDLIRLHREQSIEKTLQRFQGLVTSIPPGGTRSIELGKEKQRIGKALRQMSFEERRVVIDQGHKLIANINQTVAEDNNALGFFWRHVHQAGYDGRPEHEARDGKFFAIRDNWAIKAGLMKRGPNPYADEIDLPAVAPFCRCWATYVYNIRELPKECLTQKGLDRVTDSK